MTKKETAQMAVELLKQEYPDAICSLTYPRPHELLIATRLAAQCTDVRVCMPDILRFRRLPRPTLPMSKNASNPVGCIKPRPKTSLQCAG